jgi:hypothetical protein
MSSSVDFKGTAKSVVEVIARAVAPWRLTASMRRGGELPADAARVILSVATRSPIDTLGMPGGWGRKRCRHCEVTAIQDETPLQHTATCAFMVAQRISREIVPLSDIVVHHALDTMVRL